MGLILSCIDQIQVAVTVHVAQDQGLADRAAQALAAVDEGRSTHIAPDLHTRPGIAQHQVQVAVRVQVAQRHRVGGAGREALDAQAEGSTPIVQP
jgi:hypothetical protein